METESQFMHNCYNFQAMPLRTCTNTVAEEAREVIDELTRVKGLVKQRGLNVSSFNYRAKLGFECWFELNFRTSGWFITEAWMFQNTFTEFGRGHHQGWAQINLWIYQIIDDVNIPDPSGCIWNETCKNNLDFWKWRNYNWWIEISSIIVIQQKIGRQQFQITW